MTVVTPVSKASSLDPDNLAEGVRAGQRRAIARAITLIESTREDHRQTATALIERLLPHTGGAIRLGITGVPGVGKSTFIEAFGLQLTDLGHKVAVLAVDPSSPRSGGSILGDKTRMEILSRDPNAFIRPSPSGGSLGGVARRTREAMLVCEAAGFDVLIIETVGVGQSETTVADMVDLFMLLLVPGGGDELQGLKKGIVELADLVLVNKADGDLAAAAERARRDYANAIHLLTPADPGWTVPVLKCSAVAGSGLTEVWQAIQDFQQRGQETGRLPEKRARQATAWMWAEIGDTLMARFRRDPAVLHRLETLSQEVSAGRQTPTMAAEILLSAFVEGSH
ncbi:MAG: methylmalonyl Co-A mutase-associated GTPase MeaB [Magnetospiraceae bacterium]